MASLWGVNSTPATEQWNYNVSTSRQTTYNQRPVAGEVDAGLSRNKTTFRKKHLSNSFTTNWNCSETRKCKFTGQRSTSKRHCELQGDDEPTTKRLLSERMAAGMRKLQITEDSSKLWKNGTGIDDGMNTWKEEFTGINYDGISTWKQNLDNRLDVESDESGCEEDQPQFIIEQDVLNAIKTQNASSSLPPQILSNIESTMQLVLWKPVPFPGLYKAEEDDLSTNEETADDKQDTADDNMADSPVDEDMDL
ncbi:uncharacterized protein [Antedon mediterranea]|uniref:uncharacterized protein isoform X2 n=1 Tax=Antedon mediterranea TaxID=105859 RepID=UPI003AF88520